MLLSVQCPDEVSTLLEEAVVEASAEQGRRRCRLEVRTTEQQDGLLKEAATLENKTVSAFVLETATERAQEVIAEHRDMVLSPEVFDAFYAELDRPAEAVPELVELFNRPRRIPRS